jgi:hypothetical protein
MTKFDQGLNILIDFKSNHIIHSIESYDDKLYILQEKSLPHSKHIYVYDENLRKLDRIGQNDNKELPFYVSDKVEKMQVTSNYYVLYEPFTKSISLMNKNDGAIKGQFLIKDKDFVVDKRSNYILSCKKGFKQLFVYDFDGSEHAFNYTNEANLKLVGCLDGKLIVYDPLKYCLYFSD